MVAFNKEDIGILLEQIKWQRYREGSYSGRDPLLSTQAKLRQMRDGEQDTLSDTDIRLLSKATMGSIRHIDNYDYGFNAVRDAELRQGIISPLLAVMNKLRERMKGNSNENPS